MGRRPITTTPPTNRQTSQRMQTDQQRAQKAEANARNRAQLANYRFNDVSVEQYLAYQQSHTAQIQDFDVAAFGQYNEMREQEFARAFSANLRDYNQELKASAPNKTRKLQQWGIRNTGLYCAELSDKIYEETANALGFSEYQNVTVCRNRDYCPTVAQDLHNRCKTCCVEGGYTGSVKTKIKELQEENPYGCYLAIVGSQGNISGSGLHQVMIAPSLDENNNFIMGEDGKPKMSVYSFNNEKITDLDTYSKSGTIYNLCEFAEDNALRQIENGTLTPTQVQQYVDAHMQLHPQQQQQQQMPPYEGNEYQNPTIIALNQTQRTQMNNMLLMALRKRENSV